MKTLLFAAMLIAAPMGANAEPIPASTSDFVADYDSSNDDFKAVFEGLVISTARGMTIVNAYNQGRNLPPAFCVPKNLALGGPQLILMLRDEIAKHPNLAKEPMATTLLMTYLETFPCSVESQETAPPNR